MDYFEGCGNEKGRERIDILIYIKVCFAKGEAYAEKTGFMDGSFAFTKCM